MFGSEDVAPAAGVAGVALTTFCGSTAAAVWAWACDMETRVVAAVRAVKATPVIFFVVGMPRLDCSPRAGAHAATRAATRPAFPCVCCGGTRSAGRDTSRHVENRTSPKRCARESCEDSDTRMNVQGKPTRTIVAVRDAVEIIDQTALPHAFVTRQLRTVAEVAHAIAHDAGAGRAADRRGGGVRRSGWRCARTRPTPRWRRRARRCSRRGRRRSTCAGRSTQ